MMRVTDLIRRYRQLHRDAVEGTLAPLDRVHDRVIEDLQNLDGEPEGRAFLTTEEAAERLGVKPETVASWAADRRFPNAWKTGNEGGEWRIPREDLLSAGESSQGSDRVRFADPERRRG